MDYVFGNAVVEPATRKSNKQVIKGYADAYVKQMKKKGKEEKKHA